MTARVHIEDDWQRRALSIGFMSEDGPAREYLLWQQPEVVTDPDPDGYGIRTDPRMTLSLPEDYARALYEALADHFGHSGHDTRALRRDYDAERKRVDTLTASVVRLAEAGRVE